MVSKAGKTVALGERERFREKKSLSETKANYILHANVQNVLMSLLEANNHIALHNRNEEEKRQDTKKATLTHTNINTSAAQTSKDISFSVFFYPDSVSYNFMDYNPTHCESYARP